MRSIFFEWAPNHLSVNDPAGHSGDLSSYLSWQQRQEVETSFSSSRDRAQRALDAENRDDHRRQIRLWCPRRTARSHTDRSEPAVRI
jgi:hypothetical protein